MSGQYDLPEELNNKIKSFIEGEIHSYWGNLYEDNELSIRQRETPEGKGTDKFILCIN